MDKILIDNIKRTCELLDISEDTANYCLQMEIPLPVREKYQKKYKFLNIDDLKTEVKSKNSYIRAVIFLLIYQNSHIFNKENIEKFRAEELRRKKEEEDLPWWRVKKER